MNDTIYLTYGKYSIPHIGHEQVLTSFEEEVYSCLKPFPDRINLVSSNGLSTKMYWLKTIFPECNWIQRDLFDVLPVLSLKGYRKVHLFVGSDRAQHWERVLEAENFKSFSFVEINVQSVGKERETIFDIFGHSGAKEEYASSSLMKTYVKHNKYDKFVEYLPKRLRERPDSAILINKMWEEIKNEFNIDFSVLSSKNN